MAEQLLDEYVQRLANMRPIKIQTLTPEGEVKDWMTTGPEIVKDLMLYEQSLGHQVQIISGEVQKWGQLLSQCKRVWQAREREYRIWRDGEYLKACKPPTDEDADPKWKKPSDKIIEAGYRTHPDYVKYWAKVEEAEESYNTCQAIVDGFRAKRDMMKSYVVRTHDDGQVRLSV